MCTTSARRSKPLCEGFCWRSDLLRGQCPTTESTWMLPGLNSFSGDSCLLHLPGKASLLRQLQTRSSCHWPSFISSSFLAIPLLYTSKTTKAMDCLPTWTSSKLRRTVAGQCACGEQVGIHKGAGSMQPATSASVLLHGMTEPVSRPPGYLGEVIRLHLSF